MKTLLTKLLLILSLAIDPVSVFATDFHHHETKATDSKHTLVCSPAEQLEYPDQQEQPDNENCEDSCCEETACAVQEVCTGQQHSFFVSPRSLIFNHSTRNRGRNAYMFAIPERELPPESPPPIHN